jgi:cation diffusion facilitator CzcD-associated flavoprotein CzcO
VANGHLWDPRIPDVPGHFAGKTIHSGKYRDHNDIEGDRVLVVGSGNSGCDIAADLAQHRYDVDIVIRRGIYFQPKSYFGVPRQQVPFLAGFTPSETDLLQRLLSRMVLGENDAYPGLPMPEAATLADGATTVNSLLLYWIQHGRITVQRAIESFDGNLVRFADGTSGEYDTIVWATGFNAALPFLADEDLRWGPSTPWRTAGGILPVGVESLYFVGLIAPRGPQIPVYGVQTHLVKRMLALSARYGDRLAVADHFAFVQQHEHRIDIPRDQWNDQMTDTEQILATLETLGDCLDTATTASETDMEEAAS